VIPGSKGKEVFPFQKSQQFWYALTVPPDEENSAAEMTEEPRNTSKGNSWREKRSVYKEEP
jgi:hypothetical protein